jgi:hypothetical protein
MSGFKKTLLSMSAPGPGRPFWDAQFSAKLPANTRRVPAKRQEHGAPNLTSILRRSHTLAERARERQYQRDAPVGIDLTDL